MTDKDIKFHPAANIFPLMAEDEFARLVEDIKLNGQLEPIWLDSEGQIIDGRNRYMACLKANIQPITKTWTGNGSIVDFAVSLNLHRRHLTASQRACVATEMLPLLEEEARARQATSGRGCYGAKPLVALMPQAVNGVFDRSEQIVHVQPVKELSLVPEESGKSREKAAAATNVGARYVSDAKKLKEEAPAIFAQVRAGEKTITEAKREIKEVARERHRAENAKKVEATVSLDVFASGAKFSTIMLDPPWDWGDEGDKDQLGRARPQYSTMTIDQLLELPVGLLADADAHLYLWITNRSLPKGFQLIDKWGFRYITCLTWVKPSFGMGNYFRGSTEQLLFAVRGSMPLRVKNAPTHFTLPRGEKHSSKPLEIHSMVETWSPGPYLELFSRSKRSGWISWGADAGI
jgi:N6-adenosine-specific RNA methylase IME4